MQMETRQSAFTLVPPIRGYPVQVSYNSTLKSKFIDAKLEKDGLMQEKKTGVSMFEYVTKQKDTTETRMMYNPTVVPGLSEVGVDNKKVFRGNMNTLKAGFCGSSVIKKPVEVTIEDGKVSIFAIEKDGKKVPVDPALYRDVMTDIKFNHIKEVFEEQKNPVVVKDLQKNAHKKLDIPSAPTQYVFKADSKDQKNTLFLFAQDDRELESFKNNIFVETDEGKRLAEAKTPGGAGSLSEIITLRKIKLAEMFSSLLDQHLTAKKNEKDLLFESKLKEQQIAPPVAPQNNKPKKKTTSERKAIIRRIAIKASIRSIVSEDSLNGKKKMEYLKRIVNNLVSTSIQKTELQGKTRYMQWNLITRDLIEQDRARNDLDLRMQVHKFYDLLSGIGKENFGSLAVTQMKIAISKTPRTEKNIREGGLIDDQRIEILPVPERSSDIFGNEYRAVSLSQTLDLVSHANSYLNVYMLDKHNKQVVGFGSQKISSRIQNLLHIELKDTREGVVDNQAPVKRGVLLLVREGVTFPKRDDPVFDDLVQPECF